MKLLQNIKILSLLGIIFGQSDSSQPLQGQELRCCTILEAPVIVESSNKPYEFEGIGIDYLTMLKERLGFKCKSLNLFNASKPENQGFTGFIFEMEECTEEGKIRNDPKCQCDIGTAGWIVNSERVGRVDFVAPFLESDFGVLTHVDNVSSGSGGAFFLTAFPGGTWVLIWGLILCFIVLKLMDKRFAEPQHRYVPLGENASWRERRLHFIQKYPILYRGRKASMSVLKLLLGQSSNEIQGDSRSCGQWTVNYLLLLCGLFLVLIYEAVMTASLVQEKGSSAFRSFEDLKNCRVPPSDVCIPSGGATEALWKNNIAKSKCHQLKDAGKPRFIDDYEEGHAMVGNKTCKFFLGSGFSILSAANGRYCGEATTIGEPSFQGGISYILPFRSNLTEHFTRVTVELRSQDKIDSLEKFFAKENVCLTSTSISLSPERLKFFFIAAYGAWAVLFIVSLVGMCGRKQRTYNNTEVSGSEATGRGGNDVEKVSESDSDDIV